MLEGSDEFEIVQAFEDAFDIEIADELGTRNYELYSGGEAFRINFAIRVALSKLESMN